MKGWSYTIDLTASNAAPQCPTAVAAGLFDGVHLGHRAVIKKAAEIAGENPGIFPAVFTFETDTVTSKGETRFLLSRELKADIIGSLGVKYIYSPGFGDFRDMPAEDFAALVLRNRLAARYIVCGEDFRFGKNADGDVPLLERLCRKVDITVVTVPSVTSENGEKISSTAIRRLISEGRIHEANLMLGGCYSLKLPVACGHRIGRTINFPTINQYFLKNQLVPKFGVYASIAEFKGQSYRGVTNIGIRPTVANTEVPLAETYIEGFSGDLYGEAVKISLLEFIRPEKKFDSMTELAERIKCDVSACDAVSGDKYF